MAGRIQQARGGHTTVPATATLLMLLLLLTSCGKLQQALGHIVYGGQQLAGPWGEGATTATPRTTLPSTASSGNLNSKFATEPAAAPPTETIKTIEEQQVTAAVEGEVFQVTPAGAGEPTAGQLPLSMLPTAASSATGTLVSTTTEEHKASAKYFVFGTQQQDMMIDAATTAESATEAEPRAAPGVAEAAASAAIESAEATVAILEAAAETATGGQRMRVMHAQDATEAPEAAGIPLQTTVLSEENVQPIAAAEPQPPTEMLKAYSETTAGTAPAAPIREIKGKRVAPTTPTPTPTPTPMPTATRTTAVPPHVENKNVAQAGIKLNMEMLAATQSYANATVAGAGDGSAWGETQQTDPTTILTTIETTLQTAAPSGVGKTVPAPRLLGGAGIMLQLLANSLGSSASASPLPSPSPAPTSVWPVKHAAVLEGDVILGGLMMVHSREDSITCGPIMPQGGIQALEAMLYTLDQVNKQQLLPNVTLGAHLLDDCDKDTYGLEMAVDFIKGSISNIDDAEYHCNKTQVRKVISGVVGAASSVTSIQVANLLRLFRIPQVSYFSTSPELSNKQRFEYFSRTIPSDHYQVKAMVEIVMRMGWSYVSIIYEESNYGIKAFEELEELLARHNICIAIKEKLVKDSGVAEDIAYDNIVQKLLTKPRARGAIIFGSDQEVRQVMRAVRRANATGSFSWIGSDGWSARNLVSDDYEPEVEGTLSVQPQANPVRGFEEYFLNLTVENNQRNPWFVEFWEDHFQCRYPGSTSTPYNNYTKQCTNKERLSRQNTDFEDQLQFVSDAVMAFAYALRDMHHDLCGGRPSLCDAMKPTKGADLLKYLRKVQFKGLSGDHFRFDVNGDGPARYNIIHFKQSQIGQYHWVKVGEYYEGELRLNMSEVKFKRLSPKPPESVCSLPCDVGQAKKYVEGESCCWHCFNCTTYQIRHPDDETHCQLCKWGTLPDAHKQYCRAIPEVYLRPESAWAIGAMAFSSTGILITLFVMGVFVKHNDTPIVRASGRELSYILLAGIFMCYGVTFALVLKPSNIVCAIQRFGVGFCFTVVYAALLTKTNRIARIFKAGKQSAKRPSFISPKSQLVICMFLVTVQILINGVWMVIAPSHAMHHYPTREDNMLVCDSYIDASYMIAFFYPIVLIVICTVYAVLTRKIPEAFNESKHIGFTMYTTCVIWLAFVPLYFGTANHVPLRITSMSVTISLSASVTIACLFSPKLYIILIRPERNVRQSMMPPRHGNMHRTAGTGPSSMMAAAVVGAATCAQEEKIQRHITPTNTEASLKTKKLCEMATQTISSIFTSLDINTYNQIPYADQFVPNNTAIATSTPTPPASGDNEEHVVSNNNKINQMQHGQAAATNVASTAVNGITSAPATTAATAAAGIVGTTAAAVTAIAATVTTIATSTSTDATGTTNATNGSHRGPVLQTNL
ncbi:metabotropic glutamate receptor 2 isoform X1 [Drosophila miranda]|uniref:metabotropic glutamate receptor 2 isoform X1 n=1 Tax=Drosophila miranda TaxID=7229 RepID=UPI00143F8336|nr:metabotropic glutamate receptor 2 isoform X1 [Drosophila miranda]XP_033246885.1 metabotropic glutamate receptor 2 isoform X1 [Drosophila miranda]